MSTFFEEGTYRAEIAAAGLAESKAGNPQVTLELNLLSRFDKEENDWLPPRVSQFTPICYMTITDKTMGTPSDPGWVRKTLVYLGCESFDDLETLIGKEVKVTCLHEEGRDKTDDHFERWNILREGESRVEKASDKKLRELNAKFKFNKDKAKKTPGKKTSDKKQAKPKPDENEEVTEDGQIVDKETGKPVPF